MLFEQPVTHSHGFRHYVMPLAGVLAFVLVLYENVFFAYSANVMYTEMAIVHEENLGYFNRLVTRIQSTEGYTPDLKIAYIGGDYKDRENYAKALQPFYGVYHVDNDATVRGETVDDSLYPALSNYNWREYMLLYCGFKHDEIEENEIESAGLDEAYIAEMPCYPSEGSIKIINDVIVVKFADVGE